MLEQVPHQMTGAAVHHAHTMASHHSIATASVAFLHAMAVARLIGPGAGGSTCERERRGHDKCQQSLCSLLHVVLLYKKFFQSVDGTGHYRTNKPPSPFSPLKRN